MNRNMEVIRAILEGYKAAVGRKDNQGITVLDKTPIEISVKESFNLTDVEYDYHFWLLEDAGFICRHKNSLFHHLTWLGHEYLDSLT